MAKIRIGISGWTYDEWSGRFYPEGLPAAQRLRHVGEHFTSAEINGTFYSLESPDVFRRWADATPADFVFAVKGSRYITHTKRLRDVTVALANFLANGLLALGPTTTSMRTRPAMRGAWRSSSGSTARRRPTTGHGGAASSLQSCGMIPPG
jgi:uncharacterized protein YecE (DUF72 family)